MMTLPESIRLVCYFVGAPAFLVLASDNFINHRPLHGVKDLGISVLLLWYMIDITMVSTGVNTREYRIIGTPMIMTVTTAGAILAGKVLMAYYRNVKNKRALKHANH